MYNKFKEQKSLVLIAGEDTPSYPGGKYLHQEMQRVLTTSLPKGAWGHNPNGSFLIGYTKALVRVLEANQEAEDDRAGYCEMLYEKSNNLSLDTRMQFCACFPKVPDAVDVRDRWILDQPRYRIKGRYSNAEPLALHFPGNNYPLMQELYRLSEMGDDMAGESPVTSSSDSSASSDSTTASNWGWIVVIAVAVAVIVVVALLLLWLRG